MRRPAGRVEPIDRDRGQSGTGTRRTNSLPTQ